MKTNPLNKNDNRSLKDNKIVKAIKSIFGKISDGFWNAVGAGIAVTIGTFLGTYLGGKMNTNVTEEKIAQAVESAVEKSVETTTNLNDARAMELEGFKAIANKDLEKAICSFQASDSIYPTYHASYEIANYLKANREKSSDSDFWKDVYDYVQTNYWGYIPPSMKDSLR